MEYHESRMFVKRVYEMTFKNWFERTFPDGVYSSEKKMTRESVTLVNLSEDETAEFLSFFDEEPNFEKDFQEEIINLRSRNIERILLMISGSSEGRRYSELSINHRFIFFESAYNSFSYINAVYEQLKKEAEEMGSETATNNGHS